MLVGIGVNLIAAAQHARRLATLDRGELFRARPVFGVVVALLLA